MTQLRAFAGMLAMFALTVVSHPASGHERSSATVAGELVSLMTHQTLDAFAMQDPEAPNRFLAVLLIPNAQLLVVSAEYSAPAELNAQLAQNNYRSVYTALHQPASAPTSFFLLDFACDGLQGNSDAVDVLYEKGTTQTIFNGDWKSQDLSADVYRTRVKESERRYSQILGQLTGALRASTSQN